MAEVGRPVEAESEAPLTPLGLVNLAHRLAHELRLRLGEQSNLVVLNAPPTQQEICDALFDVSNATQKALIANNCPGV